MNRIGVDVGGSKVALGVLAADGQLVYQQRRPTPVADYSALLALVRTMVDEAEREVGYCSVGVGAPGATRTDSGLIKNANSTVLNGNPFGQDLSACLNRPVRLANDANCMALSEAIDGAAAGAGVVFGVILGTGVGGAIVVNQQLLEGVNRIGGEWGHNSLPWPRDDELPGPDCYCGRQGCIECWLSGPGLLRDYTFDPGGESVASGREVCALANQGVPAAVVTLDRYFDRLARSLASVINILDPDVIVCAGGVSLHEPIYIEVPKRWGRWVFSDTINTKLVMAAHGDASGVRGAAWLWPGDGAG